MTEQFKQHPVLVTGARLTSYGGGGDSFGGGGGDAVKEAHERISRGRQKSDESDREAHDARVGSTIEWSSKSDQYDRERGQGR